MSFFKFDAFLLQGRNLLFGLFFSVGTGKNLDLTRSLAFLRHLWQSAHYSLASDTAFGILYPLFFFLTELLFSL